MSSVDFLIRDFRQDDADAVNRLAVASFDEFRTAYSDWRAMAANISKMSSLANVGELIVADCAGTIMGAVTYVAPNKHKAPFFDLSWAVVRMLAVGPKYRGQGIGGALMQECVRRAKRDRAYILALHSSPIMSAALRIYREMGFTYVREGTPVFGVPTAVYVMQLHSEGMSGARAGSRSFADVKYLRLRRLGWRGQGRPMTNLRGCWQQ